MTVKPALRVTGTAERDIRFYEGKPSNAGPFIYHHNQPVVRIAWWPEGVEPTLDNIAIVVKEYDTQGSRSPIGRERVRELMEAKR